MQQFCKPIESIARQGGGRSRQLRLLLLLVALGGGPAHSALAQQSAKTALQNFNLSSVEMQSILQKCLDLPAMQQYYPVDATKAQLPVNIMQLPIAFPTNVVVNKGGQRVNFIETSKAEYAHRNNPAAYAMFRTIEHTGETVKVHFNYFYKTGSEHALKPLFVVVELKKAGADWKVVTSSVKE